jgi:4-amino-4-deoxy-L-arabinose transferase-like glycosyltransferase
MLFIEKIKNKKGELIFIAVLILVGIFLRSYNFSDWLHFEIDQDYDILLVDRAVENGISSLPLLGPNAGGGLLRLGPIYYYMQYASAIIFGNTPTGNAVFVLIFSILALPLFYIFSRRYFSKPISLGLLAILSTSLFSVLYSRFAWSPNVLPFLMLLAFYSLLRSVSKDERRKERWFLLSVFTTTVITQIHFNVLFVVPAIFVIFLIIKRPRFNYKVWLAALVIIFIVYSPMIASEIKTNGQNISYFTKKMGKVSPDGYDYLKISKSFMQNLHYISSEFFVINSGIDYISGGRVKEFGFPDDARLPWRIGAMILFLVELCCFFGIFFRFKHRSKEEKDFLVLCGLWFSAFFLYFFYLVGSYKIVPRFFLPLVPLAIIFFGFLLERIKPEVNKKRLAIFSLIIVVFCVSNLVKIRQYFNQLSNTETNSISVETEDVLPNTARITLSQQNGVIDYMESIQLKNGYPVYIETVHEFEPVLWYRLEKDGIDYKGEINPNYAYREGNYFLVFPTSQNKQKWSYLSNIETKTFGSLTVAHVAPDPSFVLFDRQISSMDTELEVKKEFNEIGTWGDFVDSLKNTKKEETPILYEEEPEEGEPDSNIDSLE